MDHMKWSISNILNYNPTEYMKPGIIIMIHSKLHNHFSLINVTALLSFLKAAGSSINLTVHKNSLGNNNFLVDVAHTHLHTLWAQGGTLQLKIRGGGAGLAR